MTAGTLSRRLVLLGVGAALVAPAAFAHRVEACFTTVEWNAPASTIEVVHRLHQQDAEVAIGAAAGSNVDVDITKVRNQARAGAELMRRAYVLNSQFVQQRLDPAQAATQAPVAPTPGAPGSAPQLRRAGIG
jgi:hypothetical protein